MFGTKWFVGRVSKVVEVSRKRKRDGNMARFWFSVVYTDGDAEELDWEQLLPLFYDG